MKILLVHNYFHIVGGAETYFFNLAKLLERKGHQVIFFSMADSKNLPSKFSHYFVSNFPPLDKLTFIKKIKALSRIFYSFEAKRKIRQLIKDYRPDIVHIHNIWYEITHSIILEIKRNNIPIIMTLHDYRSICPNHQMLIKKELCSRCIKGAYVNAILRRCLIGSLIRSTCGALINYFNTFILQSYKYINLFISPSLFLLQKIKESNLGRNIEVTNLPYCIDLANYHPEYENREETIVYFGRLSYEKGLDVLLDAVKNIDITLKIIGTGPMEDCLRKKIKAESITNVQLMGFLSREQIIQDVSKSLFSVLPSLWYENYPNSIIESFALGKPIVASRIGGIPELIRDRENGLLFSTGDSEDLKSKIESMLVDKKMILDMGRKARLWVEENLDCEKHYPLLMDHYKKAIRNYESSSYK
jgi:glycosyltransferase involved in cell wall biosynthesis